MAYQFRAVDQFREVNLFGGAITSRVPVDFRDASDFREVPDHQEVYVSMTDGVDISIIFDIALRVEAPAGPSDMDAVDFHFEDVAMDQDRSAKVFSKRAVTLPNLANMSSYQVIGTVSARPVEQQTDPPTFTAIIMTIIRLVEQKTDIVVTINVPFNDPKVVRTEKCIASPIYTGTDIDTENGSKSELLEFGMQVANEVVRSFKIVQWGLFVPDEENE